MTISLEYVYRKLIKFLNKEKIDYIIIGGLAAGVLGEPRMTGDIDVDVILEKEKLNEFLNKAKKYGFKVNTPKCVKRMKEAGVFQIEYDVLHIDFIVASIDLEREAIKRRKKIRLYNMEAYYPTPENFILLKIIPGRPQDLIDVERVIVRYKDRLDIKYLKDWAQRLSDEAQDMRIYRTLEKVLSES